MTPAELARRIAAAYAELPEVEAVALGGSQTTGLADARSDLDLYVYAQGGVPLAARREIATRAASRSEVGNDFFEPGDEWVDLATGLGVDAMFRSPAWIEGHLKWLLEEHGASVGFSTALWHNVLASEPLFDRSGWYARLRDYADRPYPAGLREAVVRKNRPLLRGNLSSYRSIVAKAVERGDPVSVHHHADRLLASYFDVLFAVNERPHPGEKRLLEHLARLPRRPEGAAEDVRDVLRLAGAASPDLLPALDRLVDRLDALLGDLPEAG